MGTLVVKQLKFQLKQLADLLNAEMIGDPQYKVDSIATIESAEATDLTFVASEKYEKYLADTRAGIVVLSSAAADKFGGNKLLVSNPYLAYAQLSKIFDPRPRRETGVHPSATVAETAKIAASASIGANCVIGENVVVGENVEIYPGCFVGEDSSIGDNGLIYANVSLYSNVKIGKNAVIHSGTAIGSDGFGFAPSKDGWTKIHQLGGVTIGDNVDIGANTAIDRGALEDTVIEDNVIIDNLVHIAHNVKIGSGSAIAGCVGIAGSAVIGKNCTVAGAVAINGHIDIADNTHFHGGTIVTKGNAEAGIFASATPMMEVKQWRKNSVRYRQLDDWAERLKALEKVQKNKD